MPFGASLTENVRCALTSSAGATAGGSTMGSSVADAEDSEEVVSLLDSEVAEVSAVVCVSEMVVLLVDSICDDAH